LRPRGLGTLDAVAAPGVRRLAAVAIGGLRLAPPARQGARAALWRRAGRACTAIDAWPVEALDAVEALVCYLVPRRA
jgi:hypothetical protein